MNGLSSKKLLILFIVLAITEASCNSRFFVNVLHRKNKGEVTGVQRSNSREPLKVRLEKKRQEARNRKNKRAYFKSVRRSRKRTIEIQTPEVQARMKQNNADVTMMEKAKRKKLHTLNKELGKKYK